MKVGLAGRGFVGDALYKSFVSKKINIKSFDKYKKIGKFEDILNSDFIFLCLPTPFSDGHGFDTSSIDEVCLKLKENNYSGLVIIKSTVDIGTTLFLKKKYSLNICHNPEFLTARTSYEDFENQKHIVIGKTTDSKNLNDLILFYTNHYGDSKISVCSSCESESMKLFLNCFYATKVQFFNELFLLSNKLNLNFDRIRDLMLFNGWINNMHTKVPGPDGQISYGGACFPKDTQALRFFMKNLDVPNEVLSSVISERNKMRND